jgi:predicted ester cyclase
MTGFFDAFPDVEHECGEITVAGDTVSAELRVHGNHTRPLVTPQGAIPATNRPMEIHAMNHLDVGGGAITKLKISFDAMDMMRQLAIGE